MLECALNFDPTQEKKKEAGILASITPAGSNGLPSGVDAIVLAFYFLMEAANTSAQSANVHAKQLQQNAIAQQALDNKAAGLQWNYVPTLKENHHTKRLTYHYTTWDFRGFPVRHTRYKFVRWTTEPNATAVSNAEAKNQRVVAQRQEISDQINVLQQNAQMGETNINTFTDDSMQAMQEGQNLLQILEKLTFQALLRQPPQ